LLIIFDLDDTLVETSKCLTTRALKNAFYAMKEAGLSMRGGLDSFPFLIALNERAISSKQALKSFCSHFGEEGQILSIGIKALSIPLLPETKLDPVVGAFSLLKDLGQSHDLALVTLGGKQLQMQKLEKAGIQPNQFCKLVIGGGPSKKPIYQKILKERGIASSQVLVCGDRVSVDLSPAKELGMVTVHFQNGRGMYHTLPEEDVDYTIDILGDIKKIIKYHE